MDEWTDRVSATVKESYEFFDPERIVLEEISKYINILEIGSGMGRYTKLLPRVVGLEYSRVFLEYCAKNIKGLFLRGDGFHLPFSDNSFDCVFSSGVLEHFEDRVAFAREHFRVCRPGGKVIITVPAHDSPDLHRYRLQVECLHPPEQKDWQVYGQRMPDHEMRKILSFAGLSEIEIRHLGTPLRGWKANIKKYLGLLRTTPSLKIFKGLFLEAVGYIISTKPFRNLTRDFIFKKFMHTRGNYLFTSGVKPLNERETPSATISTLEDLLTVLVCPISLEPLHREGDRLVCASSGRFYPIVNGIPYLTPEDAVEGRVDSVEFERPT